MLLVYIKYYMCDLICDGISCCVWSWDMGKINVYEKNRNLKPEKIKYGNQRNFYINLQLIDGLGMNSQFVNTSWCQRKRWHHLPYVTHIATL